MSREPRTSSVDKTIDDNLKRAFDDIASEPLPSRFTELLDALRNGTPNGPVDSGTDNSK